MMIDPDTPITTPVLVLEIPLRPNFTATVHYPLDVTADELMSIAQIIGEQPARDEP